MSNDINGNRRRIIGAAVVALAAAGFGVGCGKAQSQSSTTRPPELMPTEGNMAPLVGATEWLNTAPLTGADLRGLRKVVLVNLWTYTCINWLRQLPYVRSWAEKYKDQGLVVIGVHTPEFSFEHNVDNVRQAAKDMRVDYPIAIRQRLRDLECVREPLVASSVRRRRDGPDPTSSMGVRLTPVCLRR